MESIMETLVIVFLIFCVFYFRSGICSRSKIWSNIS